MRGCVKVVSVSVGSAATTAAVLVVLQCAADGGVAGGFSSVGGVGDWAPRGNNQMHILNRMLTSHGHFPFGETRLVSE